MAGEANAFILILLAVIFPPAAVAFLSGCGADFCLNLLLTLLAYLPGLVHAIWLIIKRADADERYGYKNWTYSGMGEYTPRGGMPASAQQTTTYGQPVAAAPPQGQYPAATGTAPPLTQAPAGQQPGGYAPPPQPPPPPSDVKYGYQAPPEAPVDQKIPTDQKQREYHQAPPEASGDQGFAADQKQGEYQAPAPAPAQVPADQKAIDVTPQAPPPADQK